MAVRPRRAGEVRRFRGAVCGALADAVCVQRRATRPGPLCLSGRGVPHAGNPRSRPVEDFRRRALGSGLAVFLASALVLLLSKGHAPLVMAGLMTSPWALPLHLATGVTAIAVLAALWFRRFRLARVGRGASGLADLLGLGTGPVPAADSSGLHHRGSAAPLPTLRPLLIATVLGGIVLAPSLWYLFHIFKGVPADPGELAHPSARSRSTPSASQLTLDSPSDCPVESLLEGDAARLRSLTRAQFPVRRPRHPTWPSRCRLCGSVSG